MALNVPAVGDVAEPLASERGWLGAVREFWAAAPQSDDIAALAIRRVTW